MRAVEPADRSTAPPCDRSTEPVRPSVCTRRHQVKFPGAVLWMTPEPGAICLQFD
jgi:hypothetical protein